MVSRNRAKGNATVRRIISTLDQEGYISSVVERSGKFIKNKDMFSAYCDGFDIVSIKLGETLFIQAKTNNPAPNKSYISFAERFSTNSLEISQWIWKKKSKTKKSGFFIKRYTSKGEVIIEDRRVKIIRKK